MAEVIGILGICVESISLSKSLVKIVSRLKAAPNELFALANEVSNVSGILQDLRDTCDDIEAKFNLESSPSLNSLLHQVNEILARIRDHLRRWMTLGQHGDSWHVGRRERILWLRERRHVIELQKSLKVTREDLTLALGANARASTSKLVVELHSLSERFTTHQQALSRTAYYTAHTAETVVDLARRFAIIEDNFKISDTPKQHPSSGMPVAQKVSHQDTAHETSQTVSTVNAATDIRGDDETIAIQVSRQPKRIGTCWSGCPCKCHGKYQFSTPAMLERIAGRLFYGYAGRPSLQTTCDVPNCRKQATKESKFTYFFPRWFVQQAVLISFGTDAVGSPSFNLRTRRVVGERSDIFTLSRQGDIQGIQHLFSSRVASPSDVHCWGHWGPLHFAVDHGQVETCRLLLENGADPEWEDRFGTSPVEVAWRNILRLKADPETAKTFSVIFPGANFLQTRGFTWIHKLVLNLEQGDLDKAILRERHHLDTRDLDGWTPAHWAARRGASGSLSILLQHSTDFLLTDDTENRTALHFAALSNSVPCLQLLLAHRHNGSVLDINARDTYGCTPLRCAAEENAAAAVAYLLACGANPDIPSITGDAPVSYVVSMNSHEAITQLLNAGANHLALNDDRNSILHFAASQADIRTLALLAWARLRGLDVEAKNMDGFTASEIAEQRVGAPAGFMDSWRHLMESLSQLEGSTSGATSGDEDWHSFSEASWCEAESAAEGDLIDSIHEMMEGAMIQEEK